MQVSIRDIAVDHEGETVVCSVAEVSVAVSTSGIAVRLVPVDSNALSHPEVILGVLGSTGPGIQEFIDAVKVAVTDLIAAQGV